VPLAFPSNAQERELARRRNARANFARLATEQLDRLVAALAFRQQHADAIREAIEEVLDMANEHDNTDACDDARPF
jgi:hypothetical protein